MKTTRRLLVLALLLPLSGCETGGFSQWLDKPTSQAALTNFTHAIQSYMDGNQFGAVVDAIQGGAQLVRSLQATPKAAQPGAVSVAMKQAGAPADLAAKADAAVQAKVATGASPSAANEQVMRLVDSTIAKVQNAAP